MNTKRRTKQKGRLPRYTRAKQPPGISLQPRDVLILNSVGCEYRYLTTRQIHTLFFNGSMSQTRLRLTKLYHNGYLDRVYRPVTQGSGEAIYCLDRKGADELASQLDIDRGQMFWQGRTMRLSQNSLEHALRVTDFRIALNVACDRLELASVAGDWIGEQVLRDLKQRVKVPSPSDPDSYTECPMVADGYFCLEFINGASQCFMLEIDMGTESNRRIGLRVRAYREYLRSGKYGELFGNDSFKVLLVTTSPNRAENLMRTARLAGDKTMFWFADFSQYAQDRELIPEQIMGQIWRVPGDWFAMEDEWRGGRQAQVAKARDTGRYRSLLELSGVDGGESSG